MYNENEPFAIQWLEQLQERNLIPEGKIDGRSITDIRPEDCDRTSHFFAGIGGWAYALQLAGWNPARDVWTGSCPCQPFSIAGKNSEFADAIEDKRNLWPIWLRLIAEYRPATIFGEQTSSKLGREWLSGVRADLEALGYAVGAADLCAASVNAPHRRQRLYWVAHTRHGGDRGRDGLRDTEAEPIDQTGTDAQSGQGREDQGWLGTLDVLTDGSSEYAGHDSAHGLVNPLRGGAIDNDTEAEQGSYGTQHGLLGPSGASGKRLVAHAGSGWGQDNELRAGWDESGIRSTINLRDFWNRYDIAVCTEIDGTTRARRLEPGTMPLVDGIPSKLRRGLIKGYGNAIVPQLAATFIRSFLEAEGEA